MWKQRWMVHFYQKIGFEIALDTENEGDRVVFLKQAGFEILWANDFFKGCINFIFIKSIAISFDPSI